MATTTLTSVATETSDFVPESFAPFPAELDAQTVKLETISLKQLLANDTAEKKRVFSASSGRGFFYLDLADCDAGQTIANSANEIGHLGSRIGKLDFDEKMKYKQGKGSLFGYKPIGFSVTDRQGTRDTAEFFNISKNDMILPDDQMAKAWPAPVMEAKPMLRKYVETAHSIALLILDAIAESLGVDKEEFRSRHRIEEHSGDHIRITRGPPRKTKEAPEIQTPAHTDFGVSSPSSRIVSTRN